jgi:short-subunit dehydrogenase
MARRSLAGLRVLVTGASAGIGRALVNELVADGARVVATARRQDRLESLAGEVKAPEQLRIVVCDVANREDRQRMLAACQQAFGGLDVLVNNAGIGVFARFSESSDEDLRKIFEVNFFAPLELIRLALPPLRQGRTPLIVNIGSVLGHRAVPGKSGYCASKFALHGFSDALRIELAPQGIDVLLVSPSTTATDFFEQATGDPSAAAEKIRGMSPQAVARRIVAAMRAGKREIILSFSGKLLVWIDRLSPPLADWLVARFG